MTKYMDTLINRLREHCDKPVNINDWFTFTTFDIISDLVFAEPFGCLEAGSMHVSPLHCPVSSTPLTTYPLGVD